MVCKGERFETPDWLLSNEFNLDLGDDDDSSEEYETDSDDESEEVDEEEDFVSSLPVDIQHRVRKMKDLQQQHNLILKKYNLERAELEKKYNDLMKPLYQKRKDIIAGNVENKPITRTTVEDENEDENKNGIPEFWIHALKNMHGLSDLITEEDEQCLEYLENISCHEHAHGYKLTFSFHEDNPFFENKILTKEYTVMNFFEPDNNMLIDVKGTRIYWKPDKCLTFLDNEKVDSFFQFFSPPEIPDSGEIEDDEEQEIMELFNHDYDVAHSIRTDIIPRAYCWYVDEGYVHKDLDDASIRLYIRKTCKVKILE